MGLKDTAAKNFFGRPDVMANLLDYVLYGGQPTVQTSQLRELSGEHYRIVQDENGRLKTDNRFRDKLFEYDTGNGKLTVGFEFQSKNDKNMVIRVMRYDIRRIEQSLSSGGHGRIINLVLSFDRKSSCLATSLEEMCGKAPSIAEKYSYNYGFVSLNIYDLVEKSELFSCKELKEVLNYFKNAQDREHLMKAITEGTLKGRLSRDAALVCAVFLGLEIDIDNEAEEIDMCKAFRDFKRECILEGKRLGIDEGIAIGEERGIAIGEERGIAIGEERGIAIGEEKALRSFIKNLLDKSFGLFDICVLTGASEEMVKEEIALAVQH